MSRGLLLFFLLSGGFFFSCSTDYTPKPRGYFRIALPEKEYRDFDSACPYRFTYPVYASVVPRTDPGMPPCWINLDFPAFKGTLYLSYFRINGDLAVYLDDSRDLVMKHIPKASAIDERQIIRKEQRVYGMLYHIGGPEAASPVQFYLTDSTTHFIRAALYFMTVPNNDSLQPVIDFLEKDIEVLTNSLEWKPSSRLSR